MKNIEQDVFIGMPYEDARFHSSSRRINTGEKKYPTKKKTSGNTFLLLDDGMY